MPTDICGVKIERAFAKSPLVLIRGLSGSGKSTLAREIINYMAVGGYYGNVAHMEADKYFETAFGYEWDRRYIGDAHNYCRTTTDLLIRQGYNVIVSNTFITKKEIQPYFDLAAKCRLQGLWIIEPKTQWANDPIVCHSKQIHSVPMETIVDKHKQYDNIREGFWTLDEWKGIYAR